MKKGLRIALALVLAVVFMFTSCDNQTQTPPVTDTVGYARFAGESVQSRDLSAGYEIQAYADLYWFYDAKKADSFGTTGAGTMIKVLGDENGKGLDGQITLSQGLWNFTLYAYAEIDGVSKPVESTLAYKGETSGVTIRGGEVTTVPVTVSPQGETGTVKFGEASFSWANSSGGSGKPVIRLTFTNRENESYVAYVTPDDNFKLSGTLLFGEDSSSAIPVGFYTCKAEAFLVSEASEITEGLTSVTDMTFSLQVIGGATTVINGVITENSFGSVSFDVVTAESDVVVFQPTADNNSVTFNTAPTEDDSMKKTVVDFGGNDLSATQNVIDITVLSQVAADKGFQIVETVTETEGKAVASISLSLSSIGEGTQTPVTEFENEVTITTYIAKGLGTVEKLKLIYVSDGKEVESSETFKHEITSYNSDTGELVFTTNHFSQFYVVSDKAQEYIAVNVTTDVGYASFADAFDGAENGDVIMLVDDVEVVATRSQFVVQDKKIEIDLAGHTISVATDVENGQGIFKVEGGGTLVFNDSSEDKTGKIDATAGNTGKVYAAISIWPQNNPGKATLIINGGTFIGYYYAIAGNGTYVSEPLTEIVINGGTLKSVASDGLGIYHPQYGNLTINDGEISGSETAVEIRAGNLDINGGKLVSTYETFSVNPNGSGTTTKGAAIAVSQHTTAKPISVDISGGRFEGIRPLNQSNPQNNPSAEESKIVINISGGEFISTDSSADAVSIASAECTGFISGGTFSVKPDDAYVARGYVAKEFDGAWTVREDGVEKGFAGGAGTQAHPYLIENVEQFMKIAFLENEMLTTDGKGAYLYFSITEDLDFSDTENLGIKLVRGELDFNNHRVTGVRSDNLADGYFTLIDDVIEGKIRNLNYEPDDAVPLVYTSGWTRSAVSVRDEWVTSFENVNVSGTFENVGNNVSLYIIQAFKGSLEFHNCENSSEMTGNQYNGVFLGGFPKSNTTERIVFDNCRFTGSLIVKNAGFLVGNSAGFASEVVVKDCVNDGLVAGTEGVGYYCGLNPDMPEVKELNEVVQKYISGSGHVRVLDSGLSASYNNDKTIVTIICNNPGSVSYKVAATGYSKMRTPDYKDYGTLLVSFEAEGEFGEPGETVNISFPVQKVVDYIYAERNGGVESQDSFGNDIVTIDGVKYYLVKEKHPHIDLSVTAMIINNQNEHIAADLDYSVYSYDADGVPTGYRKLEV